MKRASHYFAFLLTKNEQFAQQNKEQIPYPAVSWLSQRYNFAFYGTSRKIAERKV